MELEADRRWMSLAIALATRGLGKTWPNPSVGCVIVSDNKVVGRGITALSGRPHAEKVALEQAGCQAKDAIVYVTLEPCSHHGKTGPCVAELIRAKVAEVVIALKDPDPRVSGSGIQALKEEGIKVRTGLLREEAFLLNQGFFNKILIKRPLTTLKLASTFDGRIATEAGESQWITGEDSRRKVHAIRAQYDAILVGGRTVRKDNPRLTVRGLGINHKPIRVLISTNLDIPPQNFIASSFEDGPVWIAHGPNLSKNKLNQWSSRNFKLIEVPLIDKNLLNLEIMMKLLAKMGLTRILCEGGGEIGAGLIKQDLIDRIIGFTGGKIFGSLGFPGIGTLPLKKLNDMPHLKCVNVEKLGNDVLHTWTVERDNSILDEL